MIKLETTKKLLNNIVEAYNKKYDSAITIMDIKSLVFDVPFIKLNGQEISWNSVY